MLKTLTAGAVVLTALEAISAHAQTVAYVVEVGLATGGGPLSTIPPAPKLESVTHHVDLRKVTKYRISAGVDDAGVSYPDVDIALQYATPAMDGLWSCLGTKCGRLTIYSNDKPYSVRTSPIFVVPAPQRSSQAALRVTWLKDRLDQKAPVLRGKVLVTFYYDSDK